MNSAQEIISQYNSKKVPVIIETKCKIDKKKYIVPIDMTISQFHYILNNKIKNKSTHSLILFINKTLPVQTQSFGELYNLHKNEDGYLYITLSQENTFG